jgi:hypothetical protein
MDKNKLACPMCQEEVIDVGDGMYMSYCQCGVLIEIAKRIGARYEVVSIESDKNKMEAN